MSNTPPHLHKRIKASQSAIEKAIMAVKSCGLSVDKVLISGGKVELQIGGVDRSMPVEQAEGPKKWPRA